MTPFPTALYSVTTSTSYDPPARIRAESDEDAARQVADRIARRWYGRKGYCHHVRYDCRTMHKPTTYTYEAFVGHPVGNGCQGRHIWLYVQ
jgi:hypothetical protein